MYPLISEYIESIKYAKENFATLANLRPVCDEDGNPIMSSGNFAVVFKMQDEQTGKLYAVKCFLKEQEGRAEAYRLIAEELEYVNSTYLTPIKYLDKELFVDTNATDETEFPVLLMDWVDGMTLDKYIRKHIDEQYDLAMLAYQFSRLAMWLIPQPFAHGDLKPDNILVREDGSLVLVDYDGMYVPAMKGQKARELGSPDFRHPSRIEDNFDEHIDDFSLASILLSLKAISLQPELLDKYGATDRLLFSEIDYRNLSESTVLEALRSQMQDVEMSTLISLFILSASQKNLSQVSFRLFNLSKPDISQYVDENLSSEATEEDFANAWVDEYGVIYNADGTKLLKASYKFYEYYEEYTIRKGTKIICNEAFAHCVELISIIIPNSVICIGDTAFGECLNLSKIEIPKSVITIKDSAFDSCYKLTHLDIPNSVKTIGDYAFNNCGLSSVKISNQIKKIGDHVFEGCDNLSSITIPEGVTSIGDYAFARCQSLTSLFIPYGVIKIGHGAFYERSGLTSINLPQSVTSIEGCAFSNCVNLTSFVIPNGVISIGFELLKNCSKLTSIYIPESVSTIIFGAFENCTSLTDVTIPNGTTFIGNDVFSGCISLNSVNLPNSLKTIDAKSFYGCKNLTSIIIPNSVNYIGERAFMKCVNLKAINLPNGIKDIKDFSFFECTSLTSVRIPDSVVTIGRSAFSGCSLTSVNIPNSVTSIDEYAFGGCKLISIVIPSSVTSIGNSAFNRCGLNSIDVDVTNSKYDSRDNCNGIVETDTNTLIFGCSETVIPSSVTIIGSSSFSRSDIFSVKIPNNVKSIGDWAFNNCKDLISIDIPNSVENIGVGAFYGCENLTTIILPNSIKSIGKEAFFLTNLSTIIIPKGSKEKFKKMVIVYTRHQFVEV